MITNEERRAFASHLAAKHARRLGKPAPKCVRIVKRRGASRAWQGTFSVPVWALEAHPAYAKYYVLHEAAHCFAGTHGHGPDFRKVESEILEQEGIRIVRLPGKHGYAAELRDVNTGEILCGRWGQPVFPVMIGFDPGI
jgi:hypothetical protein